VKINYKDVGIPSRSFKNSLYGRANVYEDCSAVRILGDPGSYSVGDDACVLDECEGDRPVHRAWSHCNPSSA
jgi:hypothetical protein